MHQRDGARGEDRSPPSATFGRLARRRGGTAAGRGTPVAAPQPDHTLNSRLDTLQTQLDYVETLLEGLQDAAHRRAQLEDRPSEALIRRIEPARDARPRGV